VRRGAALTPLGATWRMRALFRSAPAMAGACCVFSIYCGAPAQDGYECPSIAFCGMQGGAEEGPGPGAGDVLHGGATPCTV